MSGDNKGFWQRFAFIYGAFMKKSEPLYRKICEQIAPELNARMSVLELACGTGQLTFPLCDEVKSWRATDFSEKMIEQAKKLKTDENIVFEVQDATALTYENESFDAVLISNALHIMPDPEKALSEIKRVLKPNGILFAPTFVWRENSQGLKIKLMELLGFRAYHKWSGKEYAEFIAKNGFSVVTAPILGGGLTMLCNLQAKAEK